MIQPLGATENVLVNPTKQLENKNKPANKKSIANQEKQAKEK